MSAAESQTNEIKTVKRFNGFINSGGWQRVVLAADHDAYVQSIRDAQSDEVRRLRSDIQTAIDLLLAFNKDAHARNPMAVTAIDEFLAYRGLGSQP